jgi:hypothetical protein
MESINDSEKLLDFVGSANRIQPTGLIRPDNISNCPAAKRFTTLPFEYMYVTLICG